MLFSYIVWVREAATFWKEPDVLIKKKKGDLSYRS